MKFDERVTTTTNKYIAGFVTNEIFGRSVLLDDMLNIKPLKYYYKPWVTIKIPWFVIEYEYSDDESYHDVRKGLFFRWYTLEIGKRKVKNLTYKKELKEYKERQHTIYVVNEFNFKLKVPHL